MAAPEMLAALCFIALIVFVISLIALVINIATAPAAREDADGFRREGR